MTVPSQQFPVAGSADVEFAGGVIEFKFADGVVKRVVVIGSPRVGFARDVGRRCVQFVGTRSRKNGLRWPVLRREVGLAT